MQNTEKHKDILNSPAWNILLWQKLVSTQILIMIRMCLKDIKGHLKGFPKANLEQIENENNVI